MALKLIRDRRLYRQQYDTFEEYCACRWDFSRPRAYELCAASEVIADLSANADIKLLPENEAQARPLTRLKDPAERQRAWHTAVTIAAAEQRPVTARDSEEAVRRLNGNGRSEPAATDSGPVYTCIQGTNADPIVTVARLYLKEGDNVADITYGQGAFWQRLSVPDHLFFKSDRITCPGSPHDFRRLPYAAGRFDVVVFDPPYAHHADTMRIEPSYNNSAITSRLRHREILDLYRLGMAEAKRILKPGGTLWVKCADEVENCRQRRGHVEVFQIAENLGLRDEDLFILIQEGRPVTNLLVWRLDRLGRSMRHLVNLVDELGQREVAFKSLSEGINTTTANGKMVYGIFSVLAEFERSLIQESTKAGLAAARARGRKGGRKPIAAGDPRVQTAKKMHADKSLSIGDICRTLRISRATFYRYLAAS